ncbi:MAG: hypothetical protein Q8R14_04625 [Candidatus Omnitrophota bacterium]|nr:hypothetical protein [Candidatus Omnitrophota bacterium]
MFTGALKIGTRRSPLALRQVDEIIGHLKGFYPEIRVEITGIDTYGDRDKVTPISDIEGTDFFYTGNRRGALKRTSRFRGS